MKNTIPNRFRFENILFYISIALCLFCLSYNAQAQAANPDWTFVYFETFPHTVWGCPYTFCQNTIADPQPQTKIAYASDYYTFTSNQIINHLDRNLFASFNGGVMLGGNYETQSCRYGTWGYGTFKIDGVGVQCANSQQEISATFSQPVFGKKIYLNGKYPQQLIVTESGRTPVSVDLSPVYDQGQITDKGTAQLSLSGKKITGLTVKSTDANYAFSIDNIVVNKIGGSLPAMSSPPNYCNVTPIARPAPQNLSGYDWTMHAEVSDADGLVLSDVRLKGRLMAERISVPYYKIETSLTPPLTGELRPSDSGGSLRSRLVSYSAEPNDERLVINAVYAIDNITSAQSCLNITQRYEFLKPENGRVCAPDPTGGHLSNNCSRWRALVTYDFKGNGGETLRSLNIAQRNYFRVNDAAKNSVALFRDCDFDPLLEFGCLPFDGIIFKKKLNPLFSEHYSVIATNGGQSGSWDNLHQTYRSYVSEPANPITVESKHVAGGCPECVHSHWRWGAHFGEPFNNGNLYFPSGSHQDLALGVVRYHDGEEHPYNFLDLINTNPEPIRSKLTFLERITARDNYEGTVPEEVVYWSSATGHTPNDEFFGYYSFFNTDEPNVIRPIQDDLSLLINKSSAEEKASLTSVDAPTSIIYGHLHEDGATRYSERDPNTIASLPNGYVNYNNTSYDIRTEAAVSGPHTVTFNVPSAADQTTFDSLRILHSEPDPFNSENAIWVDRTILSPNAPAPNFANKTINAKVYEVGPFVIVLLVNPPPPNTNVADLSVSITESADPVTAGNDLIYTVNVTNNGSDMATGTIFSNGLSPDVSFVSADAGMARFCREENGTVVCDLSSIAAGVTIPITITVKPNEGMTRFPPEGKSIINTAFVIANESDPNENNNSDTESTLALPNPNAPPTVQIQSPADAIFSGPATLSVIIGASDSDGTVSQVELFRDGTSVGNGTFIETGKYKVDLTGVAFGEHSLIAAATDNGGRKAVSNSIVFFVNGPAIVNLDSPIENSLFGRPANVTITATASNQAGSVSQVEFTADGEPIGNGILSGTNQYNLTWNNAPTGTHSLRAIATDGNGIKSYSTTTTIFITNAPTVVLTSPASGASYPKNTNITFSASSKDFDGYVAKVEFLYDGASLGMGTPIQADLFSLTWGSATVGTHTITAAATDNSGKTSTSSPISFTITNIAPTVNITSPANGATFTAPANITLSANAADSDGWIGKVEFFKGTTLLGAILNPPYNFSWTNVIAGNYSLTAKATDNDGASTTSNPVTVTVNPIGDTLLVVGNTTLSSVDTAIKTRLQNLGLNVVIKSATAAVSADATGKRVVVISDSVSPTNVNTKFRAVAVPVVTLDPQLFDDMGMCATATTNFGTTATQKNVTITNAAHPMAAGLSGTVQVTAATTTFGWGTVNANAAKIATLTTDATKATDFGYASGAIMPGLTAPARRVGFFYTASSSALTTSGGLLFDNAIKWAAGL